MKGFGVGVGCMRYTPPSDELDRELQWIEITKYGLIGDRVIAPMEAVRCLKGGRFIEPRDETKRSIQRNVRPTAMSLEWSSKREDGQTYKRLEARLPRTRAWGDQ